MDLIVFESLAMRHRSPAPQPNLEDVNAARAANLTERAIAVEQAGAHVDAVLRSFQNPSWYDLQKTERYQAGLVAEAAASIIFGVNGVECLPPGIRADLEQASTYLVRRIHPEFVKAAQDQAVETLTTYSDEFKALASGRPRDGASLTVIAHRLVLQVRAAYHAVLEGRTPIKPAVYLRACAGATQRGAR